MKTYVINMDHNIERLESFAKMMSKLNWEYSRFSAIDGKLTESKEINKYFRRLSLLSKGEIGCALSHIKLWEKLLESDDERMVIFEDDARTHLTGDTLKNLLREFYEYLTDNNIPEPDMLYLGKAMDRCDKYEHVWRHVYKSVHPVCMHAYIISRKGAKTLLGMKPYGTAIDWQPILAVKKGTIDLMVFHPSLFFQDILNTTSNLRKFSSTVCTTSECAVTEQENITIGLGVALGVVSVILIAFLVYFYFYKRNAVR